MDKDMCTQLQERLEALIGSKPKSRVLKIVRKFAETDGVGKADAVWLRENQATRFVTPTGSASDDFDCIIEYRYPRGVKSKDDRKESEAATLFVEALLHRQQSEGGNPVFRDCQEPGCTAFAIGITKKRNYCSRHTDTVQRPSWLQARAKKNNGTDH